MNFDLKKLDLEAAAIEKCDLLVFWCQRSSSLAGMRCRPWWRRRSQGTSVPKAANTCSAMAPRQRRRAWCFGHGDGSARAVRQAVLLCLVCSKGHQIKRMVVLSASPLAARVSIAGAGGGRGQLCLHHHQIQSRRMRALTRCVVGVPIGACSPCGI